VDDVIPGVDDVIPGVDDVIPGVDDVIHLFQEFFFAGSSQLQPAPAGSSQLEPTGANLYLS
jgi:hypothetical protein